SFRLPTKVDTKKVEAKVENGVLTVNIPKMEPKEEPKTTVEIK
ncbi:MAG: Hsp20 family protein, partial [Candidatus Helarchaeota archaeon]